MPDRKPRVFIGSSSEGLDVARAIHTHLGVVAEVTVWKDGAFKQNEGTLEALLLMLGYYDFAVFALTADDEVICRGVKNLCPRDNVLFEFGLFLGHLGRDRCFVVASQDKELRLPSDLHGVTITRYESAREDGNLLAGCAVPGQVIIEAIKKIGRIHDSPEAAPTSADSAVDAVANGVDDESDVLGRFGIEPTENVSVEPFNGPPSAWFYEERLTKAFPGVRGFQEIQDPVDATLRLQILCENPLKWRWIGERCQAIGADPLWWFRGGMSNSIRDFRVLSNAEVLINSMECPVKRVVAVNSPRYWQCFVYVEVYGKLPIGKYTWSQLDIDRQIAYRGYADEAYGLFGNHVVTYAEYDDGAAIIEGRPQRITGCEYRQRFLSPFNFLIAPQDSPINTVGFDRVSEELLNKILLGTETVEKLIKDVHSLPPNETFRGYDW